MNPIPKTLSFLAAMLFLGTSLAATGAVPAPVTLAASPAPATFLGELADRVAPGLRSELPAIEPLLPSNPTTSAASLLDAADALRAAYEGAGTPQDNLRATAALQGITLAPSAASAPLPLALEIAEMYARMGVAPTAAQLADLAASTAALPAAQAQAIALLVDATNQALAPEATQTEAGAFAAAIAFLDASEAASALMQASASGGCAVFEDPLQLIWIGSPCDDTVPTLPARLLQYDGYTSDDTYFSNSGGAGGIPIAAGLVTFSITSDRLITEVLDNVTLGGIFPLPDPLNATMFDAWLNDTLEDFPEDIQDTLTNITGSAILTAQFLQEFIAGVHVNYGVNSDLIRTTVPVALHSDSGGDDVYASSTSYVQGAAALGSLGVAIDWDGADVWTCARFCQGYSDGVLGVLIDAGSADEDYVAVDHAQGAGDGGILVEMGGSDTYFGNGNVGMQGSTASTAVPRTRVTALVDRSGNDQYVADTFLAQGAGAYLVDLAGDDSYVSLTNGLAISQGAGTALTLGILLDVTGADTYIATSGAQGAAINGPGLLADLGGDDVYASNGLAQGIGTAGPGFTGLLLDNGGDDQYSATRGQGWSDNAAAGALVDTSGNDVYTATGSAQGVSAPIGAPGVFGLLLDVTGDDAYTAGDYSQGVGGTGAGLLLDLNGGDDYVAGDISQGSGGTDDGIEDWVTESVVAAVLAAIPGPDRPAESGVGILLDGTQGMFDLDANVAVDTDSVSVDGAFVSPPAGGPPNPDTYTAGDFSQGSSGPRGGIGFLLDTSDRPGNGSVHESVFTAGSYSQGSATSQGIGVLLNAEGRDSYSAGNHSQASSDGGLALLIDVSGRDVYTTSDIATSHGFGATSLTGEVPALALAILLDDGGNDSHPDMPDNSCKNKGDIGLAVDTEGLAVPANCDEEILAAVSQLVTDAAAEAVVVVLALVAELEETVTGLLDTILGLVMPPPPPPPPAGTIYFSDDMENNAVSATKWTVSGGSDATCLLGPDDGLTTWRIRNAVDEPQLSPNAHSGSQYWYAGLFQGNGYSSCADVSITTSTISLTGATAPELRAWIGGSSETCCDTLTVVVHDLTTATSSVEISLAGDPVFGDPATAIPTYAEYTVDLSAHAGNSVEIEFRFQSDSNAEPGQGWNVDDVLVID